MKQIVTGLLVSALLLVGGVPWAMAEGIQLRNDGGVTSALGGVGDAAKVIIYDENGNAITSFGPTTTVNVLTIATGVTTNTTTAAVAGVSGPKTYWARVTGTGSVAATVEFRGCLTNANTDCVSLGTLTVSGTTSDRGVPSNGVSSASYPYLCIVTTSVTGTGASVDAGAFY